MRLTILFLTAAFLNVQASGVSQTVTFSGKDIPLRKVFNVIEKQTGYVVFTSRNILADTRPVSVAVNNMPLERFLEMVLRNQSLSFYIEDKTIMLSRVNYKPAVISSARPEPDIMQMLLPPVKISGKVLNELEEPVAGASVIEKGTSNGVSTDKEGAFQITVSSLNTVLVVSSVGYDVKEFSTEGKSMVDLRLKKSETTLNDVVVMGYATQKRATVTGSVVTVTGKEVLQVPVTNVSNALAGKLPGVTSVQRSGEPGNDGSTIRIRGVNTLGNNSALIVVDGIPGRSLDRVDPSSIESITVLKDASAAIYGSQAANGVILITTKRGKNGKPEFTINANKGSSQPTRLPKMANAAEYATMVNELDVYNGRAPRYTADQIQKYREGTDLWSYPNTDWFDAVLKPWSDQDYINANLSGGSDKIRYFISGGKKFQDGYYYKSSTRYDQYDIRSNIDAKVSDYVSLALDIAGRLEDRQFSPKTAADIFRTTMRSNPGLPAYWPDGTPGPDIEGGYNAAVISTDAVGYDREKVHVLNSNLKLEVKIPWVKGLALTANASVDKTFRLRKKFETPWYLYYWDGKSFDAEGNHVLVRSKKGFNDARLTEYAEQSNDILLNGLVTYEKKVGDHTFKGLVGMESRKGDGESFNAYRRYFVSSALDQLVAGGDAEKNNSGAGFQTARLNYFGRFNYNYKETYLLEFVGRYDGSYIFPEDKRYGFFPGVSAGWVLTNENFWKGGLSFVNNLKIRASWGQTGNDRIDEWQYLSTYTFNARGFTYIFNDNQENKLLLEPRIPNPEVTWEIANQGNIGFEALLLNNKMSVELDYFNNKRSQILWKRSASVPMSTGLALPRENIGKVTNKGFEFNVAYREQETPVRYSFSVNGSYARNKITFWDEAPGKPEWQRSTGKPIPSNPDPDNTNSDLYYEAIGIFRDQAALDKYPHWTGARPGDVIFKDVDGNGKIDGNDRVRNEKSNIPRFTGGFNVGLGYGQFDLSFLIQGATGAVRYIATYSGDSGNFLKDFYDNRWTAENPDASGPRTFNRSQEYWRTNNNTQFLRNTDYVRLKTMELGFRLPTRWSSKAGMKAARIYVSGYNLLTISPGLKDFDPESENIEGASYPVQRVINGGISLTF